LLAREEGQQEQLVVMVHQHHGGSTRVSRLAERGWVRIVRKRSKQKKNLTARIGCRMMAPSGTASWDAPRKRTARSGGKEKTNRNLPPKSSALRGPDFGVCDGCRQFCGSSSCSSGHSHLPPYHCTVRCTLFINHLFLQDCK
jgi:hypothetical protein